MPLSLSLSLSLSLATSLVDHYFMNASFYDRVTAVVLPSIATQPFVVASNVTPLPHATFDIYLSVLVQSQF